MSIKTPDYKKYLINSIKDAGKRLINQAESICDDVEKLSDISIWIRWSCDETAVMDVEKTYIVGDTRDIEWDGVQNG